MIKNRLRIVVVLLKNQGVFYIFSIGSGQIVQKIKCDQLEILK